MREWFIWSKQKNEINNIQVSSHTAAKVTQWDWIVLKLKWLLCSDSTHSFQSTLHSDKTNPCTRVGFKAIATVVLDCTVSHLVAVSGSEQEAWPGPPWYHTPLRYCNYHAVQQMQCNAVLYHKHSTMLYTSPYLSSHPIPSRSLVSPSYIALHWPFLTLPDGQYWGSGPCEPTLGKKKCP